MGLGAVIGALLVVTSKNPITSVLSLLGTFFCLATIYLLAGFQFLAAAQILVYGGAVMVLFLFVVMLLNLGHASGHAGLEYVNKRRVPFAFAASGMLIVLTFAGVIGQEGTPGALEMVHMATVGDLASLMFGSFLLPFEAASILLMAAAVAVIVLAKRERTQVVER